MRNQNFPTFHAEDGLLRTFFRKSEKHKKGKKCFDFLCGNFSFDLYFFPGGFKKSSYFFAFFNKNGRLSSFEWFKLYQWFSGNLGIV